LQLQLAVGSGSWQLTVAVGSFSWQIPVAVAGGWHNAGELNFLLTSPMDVVFSY
jgi:hypothetical protein